MPRAAAGMTERAAVIDAAELFKLRPPTFNCCPTIPHTHTHTITLTTMLTLAGGSYDKLCLKPSVPLAGGR